MTLLARSFANRIAFALLVLPAIGIGAHAGLARQCPALDDAVARPREITRRCRPDPLADPGIAGRAGVPPATNPADQSNVDLAFGAYQRGFYETALKEAMKRVAANKHDSVAMTLHRRAL